jgi:uncharacterized protein YcaQ
MVVQFLFSLSSGNCERFARNRNNLRAQRETTMINLRLQEARQLAVMGQLLSAPNPESVLEVVRWLGSVQVDPTNVVARTEHLVLWSRLGKLYRREDLDRLLWKDRTLFEYRAHIVPTSDYAIYKHVMRKYPDVSRGERTRHRYIKQWLKSNAKLRYRILLQLRRKGPLSSRDMEGQAAVAWRTGGWNDQKRKQVGRMLDVLGARGEIAIVGRDKQELVWDLAERWFPSDLPRVSQKDVDRINLERQIRTRGIAKTSQFTFGFAGRPPGWEKILQEFVQEGTAIPVKVEGLSGLWYAHKEILGRRFQPRTTLLSPFDRLISNRERTQELFAFNYRLEIYVPPAKRRFGYYVLPILHGDRLIGRIDPTFDKSSGELRIRAVYAEEHGEPEAGADVARAIRELGTWLGASRVSVASIPKVWERAFAANPVT